MRIGEAAQAAGLTAKQVRFYDDAGVIRAPQRRENNYRDFAPGDVERLVLVRRLRELDLPLDEVRQIVRFCFDGRCDLMNASLRDALLRHRDALRRRALDLRALDDDFDTLLKRLDEQQLGPDEV